MHVEADTSGFDDISAAAERAAQKEKDLIDSAHGHALEANKSKTASAIKEADKQAAAAEKSIQRQLDAINNAEGQAIEADRARTASAEREASRQAVAASNAAQREIDSINNNHGQALEIDRSRTASVAREAARQAAAIESAVQREIAALDNFHGQALEADRARTASAVIAAERQASAVEAAANREEAAINRSHGQALEADRSRTASALREANRQAAATENAIQREIAAISRAEDQAIAADRARTRSAEREAARQQQASEEAHQAMVSSMLSASKSIIASLVTIGTSSISAFTYIAVNAAKSANEMEVLAAQASMSSDAFRALGFATEQYGVSAEQASEMSKDLFDRLGEFTNEGKGELEVLGIALGKNNDQLREYATTLSSISGEDAFATIVSDLDDANVSGAEMVAVMEAIASDTSKLIPLYRDQGKEHKALKKTYEDMAEAYKLSATESKEIKNLNVQFSLLSKEAELAATKIAAAASPAFVKIFSLLSDEIESATGHLSDFFKIMDSGSTLGIAGDIVLIEQELESLEKLKNIKISFDIPVIGNIDIPIGDWNSTDASDALQDARIAKLKESLAEKQALLKSSIEGEAADEAEAAKRSVTLKKKIADAEAKIASDAQKKSADQAFRFEQDLQTRSLGLMVETGENKYAIAEANAAAISQIELNALDHQLKSEAISEKQHADATLMLKAETASKIKGIQQSAADEALSIQQDSYQKDYDFQSDIQDRRIALMEDGEGKTNEIYRKELADLQNKYDQGLLSTLEFQASVVIVTEETDKKIKDALNEAQQELYSSMSETTSSLAYAIDEDFGRIYDAIDELFILLSKFDGSIFSGGIFQSFGSWFGTPSINASSIAAPPVSLPPVVSPSRSAPPSDIAQSFSSGITINSIPINISANIKSTLRGQAQAAGDAVRDAILSDTLVQEMISASEVINQNGMVNSRKPGGVNYTGRNLA